MPVTRSFKQKINEHEYGPTVDLGAKAENIVVAGFNRGNGQQEFDRLDIITRALRTDQVLDTGDFTTTAPYTATVEVPGLLTTDALAMFVAPVPSDTEEGLTTAQIAEKMKIRKKGLAMIDNAECTQDGVLVLQCYNKRPPAGFKFWLRGANVVDTSLITFQLDNETGDLYAEYADDLVGKLGFDYNDETGDFYIEIDDSALKEEKE